MAIDDDSFEMRSATDARFTEYNQAGMTVAVYADDPAMRVKMRDEAISAGYRVNRMGTVKDSILLRDATKTTLVYIQLEGITPRLCDALHAFDDHRCETTDNVIISTDEHTLDDVFACFHTSNPHILVSVSLPERMLALSRVALLHADNRVRELSAEERATLDQMAHRVDELVRRIDDAFAQNRSESAFRFASPTPSYRGPVDHTAGLVRTRRPPLPDPRLVRQVIEQRRLRDQFFDAKLFADPAWDILLDLTAARAENLRVSVSSLCIAAAVPPTTALRWVREMEAAGLLDRVADDTDKRRVFIALADGAANAMAAYFARLEEKVLVT
ncbi:MAG: MarR family transcriptional regulator [Parerythrobacter sp.]